MRRTHKGRARKCPLGTALGLLLAQGRPPFMGVYALKTPAGFGNRWARAPHPRRPLRRGSPPWPRALRVHFVCATKSAVLLQGLNKRFAPLQALCFLRSALGLPTSLRSARRPIFPRSAPARGATSKPPASRSFACIKRPAPRAFLKAAQARQGERATRKCELYSHFLLPKSFSFKPLPPPSPILARERRAPHYRSLTSALKIILDLSHIPRYNISCRVYA